MAKKKKQQGEIPFQNTLALGGISLIASSIGGSAGSAGQGLTSVGSSINMAIPIVGAVEGIDFTLKTAKKANLKKRLEELGL